MNRREAITATTAGIVSVMGGTLPAEQGAKRLPAQRDYRNWPGYEDGKHQLPMRCADGQMEWINIEEW